MTRNYCHPAVRATPCTPSPRAPTTTTAAQEAKPAPHHRNGNEPAARPTGRPPPEDGRAAPYQKPWRRVKSRVADAAALEGLQRELAFPAQRASIVTLVDGVDVASSKGRPRDGPAGGRETPLAVVLARVRSWFKSCGGRTISKARLRLRTAGAARRTRGVAALRRRVERWSFYGTSPDAITTIGRKKAFLRYCK